MDVSSVEVQEVAEAVAVAVDVVGAAIIVAGVVWALGGLVVRTARRSEREQGYRLAREGIGRSVLLGLELMVAADIVRTVTISPTWESVGILAAIVLIRTWLSTTIEMEISGAWPWRRAATGAPDAVG